MTPVFLELENVLAIHEDQVRRYGGSTDLRDFGLLDSALAMPKAGFSGVYLHTDIIEMAAAYLYHITSNHPFIDGNKRVGAMAAYVFLALNGIELVAPEDEYEGIVRSVAQGQIQKSAVAEFLRKHSRKSRKRQA